MQEAPYLIRNRRNRISDLADHGLDTVHDTADEISAPLKSFRCQVLHEIDCLVKSTLHRAIDISADILDAVQHRIERIGNGILYGIGRRPLRLYSGVG